MVASTENKQAETPKEAKDEKVTKKPVKEKKEDLSEDDKQLKEELELFVQRLSESDSSLYKPALEQLRTRIRDSTTSMTSVPKPLKFMMPHYETMKTIFQKLPAGDVKKLCADVISVLAMALGSGRDCLNFRAVGCGEPIGSFGHEYVRHLATEMGEEFKETGSLKEEHVYLVNDIAQYHMTHNAEAEAVDMLMELERLDLLTEFVDEHSQPRVCLYLLSCVPYVPDPENLELLKASLNIYLKFGKRIEALRTAMLLNDLDRIKEIFFNCPDSTEQKQMAFMLGRQQIFVDVPEEEVKQASDLNELISNSTLSQNFLQLARELDIMEAKHPDDIYKTHLEPTRPFASSSVDSARQNLANTFVNGFVNCGFGQDKLLLDDGNKWFYKNKDTGVFSAAASQGLVYRWDIDNGLSNIDKYLYSQDDQVKGGALLSVGIISSGVQHECDPAAALLIDYINNDTQIVRIGSILGLGLAYANSSRDSVQTQVLPALRDILSDQKATPEVLGVTSLALGLICVGSGRKNAEIAMELWSLLAEQDNLNDANYRYMALAIGLIYLSRQDEADVILESLQALPHQSFRDMAVVLVESCAYAGTGNVLKIQRLMQVCSQHLEMPTKEEPKPDKKAAATAAAATATATPAAAGASSKPAATGSTSTAGGTSSSSGSSSSDLPDGWLQQAVAVLGIGLISAAEDVGNLMSFRALGHLLRYGDVWIRRMVPLAIALTSASNTQLNLVETLSKFSHDSDTETAYSAIMAMGLVGAGTNNARLGAMLRQLAGYHQRDANSLFLVRIAQGLTHMGKGTLTLHPYHSDRQLLCLPALASLLTLSFTFLDVKNTILGKQHYLLYLLVPAVQPRMLTTFLVDEKGELVATPVSVRVGQAVDVVGQAGKPKTITGFQTHTTPVLLGYGERAELATEEYLTVTPLLEGFTILKKNPNYEPPI